MAEERPRTTPQDFFLNLLAVVALYVSAVAFTTLLFQYINALFPDPLAFRSVDFGAIRFAIASLIVLFPVYIGVVWFLQKQYEREPERKGVAVRRWLVYFTLFAAALIIIGDVVALIMRFLEGELTARFFLKVVALLFVAGIIFGYYLWDLRGKRDRAPEKRLAIGAGVLVLSVVVGGFFVVGSPQEERLRRFDERRVSDLQFLQSEIVFFWQAKDRLPEALDELRDDIRGVRAPVDPRTGGPYEYRALDDLTFELCAVFETEASGAEDAFVPRERFAPPTEFGGNWDHGAGRTCFTRYIDPDVFKNESWGPTALLQ